MCELYVCIRQLWEEGKEYKNKDMKEGEGEVEEKGGRTEGRLRKIKLASARDGRKNHKKKKMKKRKKQIKRKK